MQVLRDAGDPGASGGGGKWDPKGRRGGTKGEFLKLNGGKKFLNWMKSV